MVRSSPDYSLLTDYLATSGIHRDIKFNYGSWVTALGRNRDPAYHQAMEQVRGLHHICVEDVEVVSWTRTYHDEVLECLLCLLIFFSQDPEQAASANIEQIHQTWL